MTTIDSTRRMHHGRTLAGTGALALLLLAGCQDQPGEGAPGLRDITIPADFTFETTREVVVAVRASAQTLGASHGGLEIALPSGQVLYRGPIAAASPSAFHLAVPTKDSELLVRVNAGSRWLAGSAAISGGEARFEL